MTIKVKLRSKPIMGDKKSLYLDFYPPVISPDTGKLTRREFLRLYVHISPKTALEKQHNKETTVLAEQIRQKRENYLNKPEVYNEYERERLAKMEKGAKSFIMYYESLISKKVGSNRDNWNSSFLYLKKFAERDLTFSELTLPLCESYRDFLLNVKSLRSTNNTKLSNNTASSYFRNFKTALRQAFRDGFLESDINGRLAAIKEIDAKRNYLTLDELNKLLQTDCRSELLKRAALFSALTGLRFSDIMNLRWGQVIHDGQGYYVQFAQQKTKATETIPISEQALRLMGERDSDQCKVFEGLTYSAYQNKHLAQWIGAAGITRDITFHCFRHTFATLQLSKGTDIYTVSKMLGHKDLRTTQIYAKVMDNAKRDAAEKIQLDM
jgi:integrase